MTVLEMRAVEQQIESSKRKQAIRKILLKSHFATCDNCDFEYMPFYKLHGEALCPHCDHEIIDNYKMKRETLTMVS